MESFGIRRFPLVRGGLKRLAAQDDGCFDVQREQLGKMDVKPKGSIKGLLGVESLWEKR